MLAPYELIDELYGLHVNQKSNVGPTRGSTHKLDTLLYLW